MTVIGSMTQTEPPIGCTTTEGNPADVYGDDIASVLITEEQIAAKTRELAELIAKRYPADAPEETYCWSVCSRARSSS